MSQNAGGTGPTGPTGPTGASGIQGIQGPYGIVGTNFTEDVSMNNDLHVFGNTLVDGDLTVAGTKAKFYNDATVYKRLYVNKDARIK